MLSRFVFRNEKTLFALSHFRTKLFSTSVIENERPIRPEYPSPVRHGFIPEEWFAFFYKKTGVTGPYVFATTLSSYLISKEIYVLEHEFYTGLSLAAVLILGIKNYGHHVAQYLDKQIDEYEDSWESSRTKEVEALKELIQKEKKEQWRTDGQKMIIDIKRENINMQLEAVYRSHLSLVYQEVKRRLDYQVELKNLERKLAQKHMVQWILENVRRAITSEQEKIVLTRCISDLQTLVNKT